MRMEDDRFEVGVPDPSFRLSGEERAKVAPAFDADALERLLSMCPPASRDAILRTFQREESSEDGFRVSATVRLGHPALQAVLEEVWVPFWRDHTDEMMEAEVPYLPGRDLARRRRVEQRGHEPA